MNSALDSFSIELPSWGFADTGTRFGKFFQKAAAVDLEDKLADAGHVHQMTGCCPSVATHVLWDFSKDDKPSDVKALATKHGIALGSINPNLFQDQEYKFGSFGNPDASVREQALAHCEYSIKLGQEVQSDSVSLWFADGTNYPGQGNIRERKKFFGECLEKCHSWLSPEQTLLVEYKPFEPAFYQTDIADWGMAYMLAKKSGPQSKVLVDTGHHYLAQNIEQIVAWLLDEDMLGGFHFNDRRYADDDLTLGSIDPYQIFRIFFEIHQYAFDTGKTPKIAYMIDQSHNLKPKIEAMIQTVTTAQELFVKAAAVDFAALNVARSKGNIVDAEAILKTAFNADVTGVIADWRTANSLPADPLVAHRESGYIANAEKTREQKRKDRGIVQGGAYA